MYRQLCQASGGKTCHLSSTEPGLPGLPHANECPGHLADKGPEPVDPARDLLLPSGELLGQVQYLRSKGLRALSHPALTTTLRGGLRTYSETTYASGPVWDIGGQTRTGRPCHRINFSVYCLLANGRTEAYRGKGEGAQGMRPSEGHDGLPALGGWAFLCSSSCVWKWSITGDL